MIEREIFVDNFAGGGGASTGIELAIGRSVDIAINHDPAAIAMHKANHPKTVHYNDLSRAGRWNRCSAVIRTCDGVCACKSVFEHQYPR